MSPTRLPRPALPEALHVERATLDCGARVLVCPLEHLHRTSISVLFEVGARDEPEGAYGVSHLLEHMMFRGSAAHPGLRQMAEAFEAIGADFNASTSREITSYDLTLPPECLRRGVALLAEVLLKPRLTGIAAERDIILEEILPDFDEEERCINVDDLLMEALFDSRSLGRPIAGTPESVARLGSAHVKHHYQRYYRGPNAVIVVTGRVGSVPELIELLTASFADMNPEPLPPRSVFEIGERASARVRHRGYEGPGQTDLAISVRCPPQGDPRFPAIDCLGRILDDGLASRLSRRLIDELGLVYDAECYIAPYRDVAACALRASTRHRRVRRVIETFAAVLGELVEAGPEVDELERVKRRMVWDHHALLDRPEALGAWLGAITLRGQRPDLRGRCEALLATRPEDVVARAQELFLSGGQQIVLVGQLGAKALESIRASASDAFGADFTLERSW